MVSARSASIILYSNIIIIVTIPELQLQTVLFKRIEKDATVQSSSIFVQNFVRSADGSATSIVTLKLSLQNQLENEKRK